MVKLNKKLNWKEDSIIFQCDKSKKVKKVFWWDGSKTKMHKHFGIFNHSNQVQYLSIYFTSNAIFIVNATHTWMQYHLENIFVNKRETTEEPVLAM